MVMGVLFVGASERLRVPAALISLGIGIVFGSDVLGIVYLDDMALVRDLSVVVASTDAAVVFDLVRSTPIPRRLAGILEVESGVNDPFAILLTIGLIEMTRSQPTVGDWLLLGALQLVGGLIIDLLGGWMGTRLRRTRLRSSGLYPLLPWEWPGSPSPRPPRCPAPGSSRCTSAV